MRAPAADGYPWAALFPPQCTLGGVRVRGAPSLPRTRSLAGHLPQERGPAGGGGRRAARSLHGRDRQPLPVAAGVSGATQRAGAGGRGGGVHRGAAPSGSGRLSFRGPAVARLLDDIAAGRGTIVFARDRRARRLDALRPPAGHTLDRAAATTFTLGLATALTVPLAFAGLRLDEQPDPVEIMAALRGVSGRIDIFCQAGAISAGRWPSDLVARIEDVIHEVKRPRPGHLFPPKIWLLRFIDQSQEPSFRLLVLSRHLTADRSWDTILWLDGRPGGRPRASNTSLVQFVAALPAVAVRPVAPKDGLNNPP